MGYRLDRVTYRNSCLHRHFCRLTYHTVGLTLKLQLVFSANVPKCTYVNFKFETNSKPTLKFLISPVPGAAIIGGTRPPNILGSALGGLRPLTP